MGAAETTVYGILTVLLDPRVALLERFEFKFWSEGGGEVFYWEFFYIITRWELFILINLLYNSMDVEVGAWLFERIVYRILFCETVSKLGLREYEAFFY